MAVALLAILKAGGAYVAFDPAYPPERLRYMFEDSGVALILTEQQVMANHPEIGVRSILIDEIRTSQEGWLAPAAASDSQNVESDTHPENIVYLVYTSGSTGRPKGIG
jgi:non-ribosomal peptide synthetase component F